jgi:translation elongation factor EF-Tu-like GTPase
MEEWRLLSKGRFWEIFFMIKVRANIELFISPQGRKTPFKNGYRPAFSFVNASTKISGRIDLIDRDDLSPGMTGVAIITFIKGMIDDNYFRAGVKFSFGEGLFIMGEGIIEEVIENDSTSYLDSSNNA